MVFPINSSVSGTLYNFDPFWQFAQPLQVVKTPFGESWHSYLQHGTGDQMCDTVRSLFHVSLNGSLSASLKTHIFSQFLRTIVDTERQRFYVFMAEMVPPIIAIHLLKFFSDELWSELAFSAFAPTRDTQDLAINLILWIEETEQCGWNKDEKSQFLDSIIAHLSEDQLSALLEINDLRACEKLQAQRRGYGSSSPSS